MQGEGPPYLINYTDTEHYQITRQFLTRTEAMLATLLASPDCPPNRKKFFASFFKKEEYLLLFLCEKRSKTRVCLEAPPRRGARAARVITVAAVPARHA